MPVAMAIALQVLGERVANAAESAVAITTGIESIEVEGIGTGTGTGTEKGIESIVGRGLENGIGVEGTTVVLALAPETVIAILADTLRKQVRADTVGTIATEGPAALDGDATAAPLPYSTSMRWRT